MTIFKIRYDARNWTVEADSPQVAALKWVEQYDNELKDGDWADNEEKITVILWQPESPAHRLEITVAASTHQRFYRVIHSTIF